jgi:hypothetical protein
MLGDSWAPKFAGLAADHSASASGVSNYGQPKILQRGFRRLLKRFRHRLAAWMPLLNLLFDNDMRVQSEGIASHKLDDRSTKSPMAHEENARRFRKRLMRISGG